MDKKANFPLTMRILRVFGMLDGRGIIARIVIILMMVVFSAILIYQGYVGWAVLIVGIALLVVYVPRRKRQIQTIKKKYGITTSLPYDLEHLTQLILDFNENSDTILGIDDYAFIKIDESTFPLVFGSVSYKKIQEEGISDSAAAVFLMAQGNEFNDLRLKYQEIFELGGQQKETSIYWVKDLQRLMTILTPAQNER